MSHEVEDVVLVKRGYDGDKDAAEELCTRYGPLIRKASRRYSFSMRRDLEQEGWIALLKAMQSYNPELGVPFAGYAKAVVYGDVRSAARRDTRQSDRVIHPGAWSDDDGGDGLDSVADAHTLEAFLQVEWEMTWPTLFASAGLSPREALCMKALMEGIRPADLAHKEGVSVETVKTWRKRGMQKLRKGHRS